MNTKAAVLFTPVLLSILMPCAAADARFDTKAPDEVILVKNVWIDVPLTQILRDISMETGVIIAVGPGVPDPITSLDAGTGKPLEECFEELATARGIFIHKKNNRFYIVSSGDPVSPGFVEVASPKRVYLKYITAKHLTTSLPQSMRQYVSSGERNNEVLIYAVPKVADRIMEIVDKLDIPQQQVVLEVLVVDLWEDTSDEFGIDWEFSRPHASFSMTEGAAGFTGLASYASIAASRLTELNLTLKALVAEKKASIRSRPRVATLNGEKASIEISLNEYFTIITDFYGSTGNLRTDLETIKSGVLLEMTPHIGDNGDITVDVLTEVSDVASRQNTTNSSTGGGGDLPIIRSRKAKTQVRVKQGDAIVIGGLIETQQSSEDKSVPILSSIPIVGGIFKSKDDTTVKKEVMIFITPRLIEEGEITLSDRHELIDETEEVEKLRAGPKLFDVRYLNRQKSAAAVRKEIQDLREVAAVLDGQNLPHSDDVEIAPSGYRNSLSVAEEIKVLQEVIALLDVQHQTYQRPLGNNDTKQNSVQTVIK